MGSSREPEQHLSIQEALQPPGWSHRHNYDFVDYDDHEYYGFVDYVKNNNKKE